MVRMFLAWLGVIDDPFREPALRTFLNRIRAKYRSLHGS